MAVAKVIEVIAGSSVSIEDAVQSGIAKAGETVKGIESAWVKDTTAIVSGDKVTEWRVNLMITFLVN